MVKEAEERCESQHVHFFLISSDESHSGGSGFEGMYQKYIAEQLFASIRGQSQTVFDTFR